MDINYEVKVNKSFEEAVSSLKKNLEENKFGVLWELNFKDKLKEKGIDFNTNFMVFEVCNPVQAKKILDKHIEAGYFLPCKVVVYEKDNFTFVGMLKTTHLMEMLGKNDLADVAQEVENILVRVIDGV